MRQADLSELYKYFIVAQAVLSLGVYSFNDTQRQLAGFFFHSNYKHRMAEAQQLPLGASLSVDSGIYMLHFYSALKAQEQEAVRSALQEAELNRLKEQEAIRCAKRAAVERFKRDKREKEEIEKQAIESFQQEQAVKIPKELENNEATKDPGAHGCAEARSGGRQSGDCACPPAPKCSPSFECPSKSPPSPKCSPSSKCPPSEKCSKAPKCTPGPPYEDPPACAKSSKYQNRTTNHHQDSRRCSVSRTKSACRHKHHCSCELCYKQRIRSKAKCVFGWLSGGNTRFVGRCGKCCNSCC